jgi:hypothetical protein
VTRSEAAAYAVVNLNEYGPEAIDFLMAKLQSPEFAGKLYQKIMQAEQKYGSEFRLSELDCEKEAEEECLDLVAYLALRGLQKGQ